MPVSNSIDRVLIRYTPTPAETVVSPLHTGPAGIIGFTPLRGVLLATDPCATSGTIETRIAWSRVDDDDLPLLFPMLCALYGEAAARAASIRSDSTVTATRGGHVRVAVHRLLAHLAAMDRDPAAAQVHVVWIAEALVLAHCIDPRVPLARAMDVWEGGLEDDVPEELRSFVPAPRTSTARLGIGVPVELQELRARLLATHAETVAEWCSRATPSVARLERPVDEAVAAAMLALRLERLGAHDPAARWWDVAGHWWGRFGDHRRAAIAVEHARRERYAPLNSDPAIAEVAGIAVADAAPSFGYPTRERDPGPSWVSHSSAFLERGRDLVAL